MVGGEEEMVELDGAQDEAEDEGLGDLGEWKVFVDGNLDQGQREGEEPALGVGVQAVEAGAGALGVVEKIAHGEVEGGFGVEARAGC